MLQDVWGKYCSTVHDAQIDSWAKIIQTELENKLNDLPIGHAFKEYIIRPHAVLLATSELFFQGIFSFLFGDKKDPLIATYIAEKLNIQPSEAKLAEGEVIIYLKQPQISFPEIVRVQCNGISFDIHIDYTSQIYKLREGVWCTFAKIVANQAGSIGNLPAGTELSVSPHPNWLLKIMTAKDMLSGRDSLNPAQRLIQTIDTIKTMSNGVPHFARHALAQLLEGWHAKFRMHGNTLLLIPTKHFVQPSFVYVLPAMDVTLLNVPCYTCGGIVNEDGIQVGTAQIIDKQKFDVGPYKIRLNLSVLSQETDYALITATPIPLLEQVHKALAPYNLNVIAAEPAIIRLKVASKSPARTEIWNMLRQLTSLDEDIEISKLQGELNKLGKIIEIFAWHVSPTQVTAIMPDENGILKLPETATWMYDDSSIEIHNE